MKKILFIIAILFSVSSFGQTDKNGRYKFQKATIDSILANYFKLIDGSEGSGKVLTSDANGLASWQAASGGGMADPGANGIVVRTALNTTTARQITGTTNRIAVTNANGVAGNIAIDVGSNIIDKSVTNTYTAGAKQLFSTNATTAGLNFVGFAGDPSTLSDGDVWYNSSTNKFRARENGVTVDLIGGGGSGEANTASNLGGGLANWDSKSGVDLRFNTFNATDFDLAANVISIDYTNGQAASGSTKGFLTAADWTTFNGKLSAEVDGSITNELQTFASTSDATSHTVTLSNSGGSFQLVEGSNISLTTSGTGLDAIVTIASTGGGMADPGGNGVVVRTALNTTINRTNTGTTNKITVTDGDGVSGNPTYNIGSDVVDETIANTYTAGAKQTFASSATTAGLNFAGVTANPSSLASGDVWHRSDLGKLAYYDIVDETARYLVAEAKTQTLTNKRITARPGTVASSATPTINTDNVDFFSITAQTVDITSFTTNLTGTPTEGQKLWIAITGTASRLITWGASFEASTVALPTTTSGTNRLDVGFVWNNVSNKWRCVATQ